MDFTVKADEMDASIRAASAHIEEFIKTVREDMRPTALQIITMTVLVTTSKKITLDDVEKAFASDRTVMDLLHTFYEGTHKLNRGRFHNAVILSYKTEGTRNKKAIKLFANGALHITGPVSVKEARLDAEVACAVMDVVRKREPGNGQQARVHSRRRWVFVGWYCVIDPLKARLVPRTRADHRLRRGADQQPLHAANQSKLERRGAPDERTARGPLCNIQPGAPQVRGRVLPVRRPHDRADFHLPQWQRAASRKDPQPRQPGPGIHVHHPVRCAERGPHPTQVHSGTLKTASSAPPLEMQMATDTAHELAKA